MRDPGKHFACVIGICSTVPNLEGACEVSIRLRKLRSEHDTADRYTVLWFTKGAKKFVGKAVFAGHLAHDLHQPPRHGTCNFLGRGKCQGHDVPGAEKRLVANSVSVPRRFLLNDSTNDSRIEGMLLSEEGCLAHEIVCGNSKCWLLDHSPNCAFYLCRFRSIQRIGGGILRASIPC